MGILRLLLALSVLGAHTHGAGILGFRGLNGDLAVEAFFMLSGFYMALVLNEKYRRGQYWTFLQQRYLRLWPLYFLILLLHLGVFGAMSYRASSPQEMLKPVAENLHYLNPVSLGILLLSVAGIFGQDLLCFIGIDPATGWLYFAAHPSVSALAFGLVGQAWSLGTELTFYLMAPFLVRQSQVFQGAILVGLAVVRFLSWHYGGLNGFPWIDRFFPFELPIFLAGSLAYRIYAAHEAGLVRLGARAPWLRWIFYAVVIIYSRLPGHETKYYWIMPLLFMMLPYLFATTKNLVRDRYWGELSYPFYLIHGLVIILMEPEVQSHLSRTFWGFVYAVVTLGVSALIYQVIERPLERYRHHLLDRRAQMKTPPQV